MFWNIKNRTMMTKAMMSILSQFFSRKFLIVLEVFPHIHLIGWRHTSQVFVSRSAAHELLAIKEDVQRKFLKKKEIAFVNTNKDITEMFRIVAANRAVPKSQEPQFEPQHVTIQSLI